MARCQTHCQRLLDGNYALETVSGGRQSGRTYGFFEWGLFGDKTFDLKKKKEFKETLGTMRERTAEERHSIRFR